MLGEYVVPYMSTQMLLLAAMATKTGNLWFRNVLVLLRNHSYFNYFLLASQYNHVPKTVVAYYKV